MKKKYKKRVKKLMNELSETCCKVSDILMEASLDGTLETDFDFIEKDDKFYFDIEFIFPAFTVDLKK